MTERGLSLYEIESELAQMVQAREEATETLAMAPTEADRTACQLMVDACDEAIRLYLHEELRKVDGIIAYIANEEARAEAAAAEAERLKRLSLASSRRVERLKATCLSIMQERDLKRLEGNLGTLAVQANGGVQALEVNDAMVPDEYCQYQVTLLPDVYRKLAPIIRRMMQYDPPTQRIPTQKLIRQHLAEMCFGCDGSGIIVGIDSGTDETCSVCGGDGKTHIPGAQLLPRGSHLRVR